ncbi:Oxysterol-binding protein [Trinorchestia longiramus]|nr:Oxysterol-binding protein [Trinorchestia longiramus]
MSVWHRLQGLLHDDRVLQVPCFMRQLACCHAPAALALLQLHHEANEELQRHCLTQQSAVRDRLELNPTALVLLCTTRECCCAPPGSAAVHHQGVLLCIGEACTSYVSSAGSVSRRWQRQLQHEREQRARLEEMVEQLARQHSHLEQEAKQHHSQHAAATLQHHGQCSVCGAVFSITWISWSVFSVWCCFQYHLVSVQCVVLFSVSLGQCSVSPGQCSVCGAVFSITWPVFSVRYCFQDLLVSVQYHLVSALVWLCTSVSAWQCSKWPGQSVAVKYMAWSERGSEVHGLVRVWQCSTWSGGVHSEDEEDQFQDAVEEIREEIQLPAPSQHKRSISDLSQTSGDGGVGGAGGCGDSVSGGSGSSGPVDDQQNTVEVIRRKDNTADSSLSEEVASVNGSQATTPTATMVSLTGAVAANSGKPPRQRRKCVPEKPSYPLNLWSIMKNCIGKELTKIPMPVNFSEPLSFLQRLTEDFEYSDILDRAALLEDSCEQLSWVAAFTVSSFATTSVRTAKPFNPLLGETYECDRTDDLGWRAINEQVTYSAWSLGLWAV